jgi:hypothetical protein
MKQGSIEWHEMKLGKFSASQVHKLMGKTKITQGGHTYILEKVTEVLTWDWNEISSAAIEWGNYCEPFARDHYCKVFGVEIHVPAWRKIDDHSGVSPDGIIMGKKKGIEIKCPFNPINHTTNLLLESQDEFKGLHPNYYWQIQMQMLAYKYDVWDFVSYDPRFEGINRMFVLEIKKDEDDQLLLKQRLQEAIAYKLTYLNKLKS